MQRFTLRKKVEGPKNKIIGGGVGGLLTCLFICIFVFVEELDGGGGSVRRRNTLHVVGGPTIVIVTSAVYGEREIFIIFNNKYYKKYENI
jgi:hypothetical protein